MIERRPLHWFIFYKAPKTLSDTLIRTAPNRELRWIEASKAVASTWLRNSPVRTFLRRMEANNLLEKY